MLKTTNKKSRALISTAHKLNLVLNLSYPVSDVRLKVSNETMKE